MSAHGEVKRIVDRYRLRAKKRFGQNFLVDGDALDDIASTAARTSPPGFIEVGPGPGTLTRRLAQWGRPVAAIEKDRDLVEILREEFRSASNVDIIDGDALRGPLADRMPSVERPAVVGNIPYNISSPLLVQLVEQRASIGAVTLLMQREVVDRLLAEPGSKTYGRLSVLLQMHAMAERGRLVPPGSFWPAPKVQSAVIHWTWRDKPAVPVEDLDHLSRVVRAAFSQRRKTLRNALRSGFATEAIAQVSSDGFDLQQRAERLSLADFAALSKMLAAAESASGIAPGDEGQN